jgi:tRNA(fMet)-specific endonuclease VapC
MICIKAAETDAMHMLDTDIVSYLLKGKSPAIEQRLSQFPPAQIVISAITEAELRYGLKRLSPEHPLNQVVRRFLDIVRVLPWDSNAAHWYADIRHQLTRAGKPIGEMDMMIAAHALGCEATLVSNNLRHYAHIVDVLQAPLKLENWV